MNYEELKQYLKDAYELESQLYVYQEIEHEYKKSINKWKEEKNTVYLYEEGDNVRRRAHKSNYVVPAPSYKPRYLGERKNSKGRSESVFGFKGIYDMFRNLPERWWDEELEKLEKEEKNKYRMFHALIIIIVAIIGLVISYFIQNAIPLAVSILIGIGICVYVGDENKKEYLEGDPFFEKFMKCYEKKNKKDLKTKAVLVEPKIAHVESEYKAQVVPQVESVKQLLEALYAQNVNQPKYRSFVAVTQMYEYLEVGRCTGLEGENGAYNLYEEELRQGVITTDLELSIYQWEKRSTSMYTMVSAMKANDKRLDKITTYLRNVEDNTALLAYNKQCNKENLEIIGRYHI